MTAVILPPGRDERFGLPILPAYQSRNGSQLYVWCEHENKWHYHGRCDGTCGGRYGYCTCPFGSGDGHRAPHCTCPQSPYRDRGYFIHEVGLLTVEIERGYRSLSRQRPCSWQDQNDCRFDRGRKATKRSN
jgi:hypothetical protein